MGLRVAPGEASLYLVWDRGSQTTFRIGLAKHLTETPQSLFIISQGNRFQPDCSSVSNLTKSLCHLGVIDFTGARLMPARHIRDVDIADIRMVVPD